MGEVVLLIPQLDEPRLHEALREITDASTTAVVLIATGPGYVGVRSFGPADQIMESMIAALAGGGNSPARERVAIAICQATSGGEGPVGIHLCECASDGRTECQDMLRAADAALAVADLQSEVMRRALQQIADYGPGITHGWAEHVRQVARNALQKEP